MYVWRTISIVDPGQTLEIKVRGASKQLNQEKKKKQNKKYRKNFIKKFQRLKQKS